MQKYINQLLQDLLAAQRPQPDWKDEPQTFEEYIEEVERFLEGGDETVEPSFGEVCGIDTEQFPPASRLNAEQTESLSNAIKELLWTWNIILELPDTLPVEQVYFFQIEVFDMKIVIANSGRVHIDFCEDDFNLCAFGEDHCTCKKEWEKEDQADRTLVQQFTNDLDEKLSPTAPKMKIFFSTDEIEIIETKLLPIRTLAEWFDISMEDFPSYFLLRKKQADRISEIIMRLLPPKDEMIIVLKSLDWEERVAALKRHLESKVWFDGMDTLYFVPLSEEEKSNFRSPLDSLDFDENLDFDFDLDPDSDLPF